MLKRRYIRSYLTLFDLGLYPELRPERRRERDVIGGERPMVNNWHNIGYNHGQIWASFMTAKTRGVTQEVATRTADTLVREYARKGIDRVGKAAFIRGFLKAVQETRKEKA